MRTLGYLTLGLAPLAASTAGAQASRPEPFPALDAYARNGAGTVGGVRIDLGGDALTLRRAAK